MVWYNISMSEIEKAGGDQQEMIAQSGAEEVLEIMSSFEGFAKATKEDDMDIKTVYHDGNSEEDKQIRAGLFTHVIVGPGDTLEDAMLKLDHLKKLGRLAFLNFNGRRFDNYSEPNEKETDDRIVDPKFKHELEDKKEDFEVMDVVSDIPNEGKYGLVGIVGGIKHATEFTVYALDDEEEDKKNSTRATLESLGLKYVENTERSQYSPDYIELDYYVAKTEETARRVRELVEKSREERQTGDATRELGRLFGFPRTAIEYFIERNKGEARDDVDTRKKYDFYIHSPENGEEEYRQYEQRINELFRRYCPFSAEELLGTSH